MIIVKDRNRRQNIQHWWWQTKLLRGMFSESELRKEFKDTLEDFRAVLKELIHGEVDYMDLVWRNIPNEWITERYMIINGVKHIHNRLLFLGDKLDRR